MSVYRRDIDGLRALAIVPVVLFHAGLAPFSGGFVGVDVFFVISGYLITQILLDENARGAFSIGRFYERRIRRIFPALFFMLAVVSVACLIMLPGDLRVFGRTLLATIAFASNLLLWKESGYFDAPSENNVLTHTWSLAVEEQFYIFLPVALWLAFRLGARRWVPALIGLAVLGSLVLSQWMVKDHASSAFYLLPSRAWELLLGSFLASVRKPRTAPVVDELLAGAGVLMLAASTVLYRPEMTFPGISALAPCLGSAAIIYAGIGRETQVGRLLGNRLFVGVGLISYSLYLWHWPLLVLPRLYLDRHLTPVETGLSIAVATAISAASWRWVERPFRRRGEQPRRQLFWRAGVVMGTGCACALVLATGVESRVPPHVRTIASYYGAHQSKAPGCSFAGIGGAGDLRRKCLEPDATAVLWGDSHAGQYGNAAVELAAEQGMTLRVATTPGCAPLPYLAPVEPSGRVDTRCGEFNTAFLQVLADDPSVRTVVLAGRWARFFFAPDDPEGRTLAPVGDAIQAKGTAAELTASLGMAVDRLTRAGKRVVLIGQAPEATEEMPRCLAVREWRGLDRSLCALRPETLPDQAAAKVIARFAAAKAVPYIRPTDVICTGARCAEYLDGVPILADTDHLTQPAALAVLRKEGFGGALMR